MNGRNHLLSTALFAAVLLTSLAGCAAKPLEPTPEQIQAARRAAFGVEAKIQQILEPLEHDEDPAIVYAAYRDNVPRFVKEASTAAGFELSRISSRPRNTTDAPDDWEAKKLAAYELQTNQGGLNTVSMETAEIVEEEVGGKKQKVLRWIRAIPMAASCMTCHGDAISPQLSLLIKQDYPEDGATGYYDYELRGAWSVRKVLDDKAIKAMLNPPKKP